MEVRATKKGYFGETIRDIGEVFSVPEGTELGGWMEPVAGEEVAEETPAPKPAKKGKGGKTHEPEPADAESADEVM